jgi:pantetheine-phosphate adenylyltransferase
MERIAVFPGSFDPITNGHFEVIKRASSIFDKILVAIGNNSSKQYMFPLEKRLEWLQKTFEDFPNIEASVYEGLTVDYCHKIGAKFILRGLRNPADFEFEKAVAQTNRKLMPDIDTVFLLTSSGYSNISSSIVRDVLRNGGDYTLFVPKDVRI